MNITEETKRGATRISIDFYVNEDSEYYLVEWNNGKRELVHLDKLTKAEIGDLVIKAINECI